MLLSTALSTILGVGPSEASPPNPPRSPGSADAPQPPSSPDDPDPAAGPPTGEVDIGLVDAAEQHWAAGEYTQSRQILEQVASTSTLDSKPVRERVLTFLADALLNDPALPEDERRERAARCVNRLMDADPSWRMPDNLLSPELFQLYLDLREERAQRAGETCRASLIACQSNVDNTQATLARERRDYDRLAEEHAEQEVEVREQVARSRIFAAIPLGIGHFYNGDIALGGTFLAAELIAASTGLGLLIYRTTADGCFRDRGFQTGSLQCSPRNPNTTDDDIVSRRQAEEAMAWILLGTVVVDIVIAQIRFRPIRTTSVRRIKRSELEQDAPSTSNEPPKRRRKPRRGSVKAAPTVLRSGAGLGVDFRF